MASGSTLQTVATINQTEWSIRTTHATIGHLEYNFTNKIEAMVIDPFLPYIYIPRIQWYLMKLQLEKDFNNTAYKLYCDDVIGDCKF